MISVKQTNLFTGLKQNHKVIRKKDICPKFLDGADLRFQAQHQAERYLLGLNGHIEQATTKENCRKFLYKETFSQSWPSPFLQATESSQAKERPDSPELFLPSFSVSQVLTEQ